MQTCSAVHGRVQTFQPKRPLASPPTACNMVDCFSAARCPGHNTSEWRIFVSPRAAADLSVDAAALARWPQRAADPAAACLEVWSLRERSANVSLLAGHTSARNVLFVDIKDELELHLGAWLGRAIVARTNPVAPHFRPNYDVAIALPIRRKDMAGIDVGAPRKCDVLCACS